MTPTLAFSFEFGTKTFEFSVMLVASILVADFGFCSSWIRENPDAARHSFRDLGGLPCVRFLTKPATSLD